MCLCAKSLSCTRKERKKKLEKRNEQKTRSERRKRGLHYVKYTEKR